MQQNFDQKFTLTSYNHVLVDTQTAVEWFEFFVFVFPALPHIVFSPLEEKSKSRDRANLHIDP